MDIQSLINKEREIFKTPIVRDDGWTFRFDKTIKKIERYYNSKFMGPDKDEDGFKKLFINITKRPVKTSQKSVDIDTKDIRLKSEDGESDLAVWFLEQELKQFMKEEGFAELFNEVVERYPKYGEVIVKDVDGVPMNVPLLNIKYDPQVHVENSPWVHEEHIYTLDEFRNEAEARKWDSDAVEEVVDLYQKNDLQNIEVVERYGYYKEKDSDAGDSDKLVYGLVVAVGIDEEIPTRQAKKIKNLILDKKSIKKNPYRSLSWETRDGIGLGIGVVEENFELQEFYNDVNNKERKALEWNTKKFFRTDDSDAPRNLFITHQTGSVLKSKDLQEIPMAERNLAQFNALYNRIDNVSSGTSFTFEVNTGETMPSGTPFRLGAVLSNAVNSYFNFKREKLGLFWQGIILDFVLPKFKNKKRKAHILNFSGDTDDVQKIDQLVANTLLQIEMEKYEKENGHLPSIEKVERERNKILEKLQSKDSRYLEIPEGFYDGLKTKIDIVITGEQVNTETDLTTLTSLYQVLSQQGDPRASSVLNKILSLAGQNPVSLLGLSAGITAPNSPKLNVATPESQLPATQTL